MLLKKISGEGWRDGVGYIIWFRRSDWHGKFTYSITGHEVTFSGSTKNVRDYQSVIKTVRMTSDKAKKAYEEFQNSIPFQNSKGKVIEDVMLCQFKDGKDIKQITTKNKK